MSIFGNATGLRMKGLAGGLLDLILPPMTLDKDARALTGGLSTEAWSRISRGYGLVGDDCRVPVQLLATQGTLAPSSR